MTRTSGQTPSRVSHQQTAKPRPRRAQSRQGHPVGGPPAAPVRDQGNKLLPLRTEIGRIRKSRARGEGCAGKGLLLSVSQGIHIHSYKQNRKTASDCCAPIPCTRDRCMFQGGNCGERHSRQKEQNVPRRGAARWFGEPVSDLLELKHQGQGQGEGTGRGSVLPGGQGSAPEFREEPHAPGGELTI